MTPADEGPDPVEESIAFFAWVHGLIASEDPRLRPLGKVEEAYSRGAAAVAKQVRHSAWHMTLVPSWTQVGVAQPFAELRHRPTVDLRYLTTYRALERLPMLASHHHPYLRVGHVVDSILVLDGTRVFVGGPHGGTPVTNVHESTDARVVGRAVRMFDASWRTAVPAVEEGAEPPFTRRMVQLGFRLAAGDSDREIARALNVSERTVSAEVAEIVRRLGARSRTHAIGLITGAAY